MSSRKLVSVQEITGIDPIEEPIASKSPAYWAGVWSSARTWD